MRAKTVRCPAMLSLATCAARSSSSPLWRGDGGGRRGKVGGYHCPPQERVGGSTLRCTPTQLQSCDPPLAFPFVPTLEGGRGEREGYAPSCYPLGRVGIAKLRHTHDFATPPPPPPRAGGGGVREGTSPARGRFPFFNPTVPTLQFGQLVKREDNYVVL